MSAHIIFTINWYHFLNYKAICRAYKYHAIAMRHIGEMRRLMSQQNWPIVRRGALDCLNSLEIVLLQNFAAAQIMLARPLETINVV